MTCPQNVIMLLFEAKVTMSDICTSGFVTYVRADTLGAKVVSKRQSLGKG